MSQPLDERDRSNDYATCSGSPNDWFRLVETSGRPLSTSPFSLTALPRKLENDRARDFFALLAGLTRARNRWAIIGIIPFTVFPPKFEGWALSGQFQINDLPPDGFAVSIDASNLPKGPLVLRAWSIDMIQQNGFPLAGSINVHNG